jgi:uncharacterized protein YcbK (DUF882 family)
MSRALVQPIVTLLLLAMTLLAHPVAAAPLSGNIDDLLPLTPVPCGDAVSCLHAALDRSSTGMANPEDALPALRSGGPRTDALTGAWLIVDEALNLARLEVAPEADARPVSIQRRLAAENRTHVKPGELRLYSVNTRERARIQLYDRGGRMTQEGVRQASHLLRDQRNRSTRSIDTRLLAMLYIVGQHFDAELRVVSGYRTRFLNATEGSRHGQGRACDFNLAGVSLQEITAFAEATFARVGVGVYPHSGFVHLDARDSTYLWVDVSKSKKSKYRARPVRDRVSISKDPTMHGPHINEELLYQPVGAAVD